MRNSLILSLCDYTGNWSKPYRDAGYDVRLVDLKHGQDVRLLERLREPVRGILAAPPCTVFACSGNRWERSREEMLEGLSIVDACLRLVVSSRPLWWCLENPVGKLSRYLGPPLMRFQPCEFGDPYTKLTCLWGEFCPPIPDSLFVSTRSVPPTQGSKILDVGPGPNRQAIRSATPLGFARAFFDCNP